MDAIILQTFNGLSLGSILLMVSLGLAFAFGLMGVINMAHGEFIMIGAYTAYVFQEAFAHSLGGVEAGVWFVLAIPAAFLVAALLGALSDRARGGRLHVVDSFGIEGAPSTKAAAAVLTQLAPTKNVMVVIERGDELTLKSIRNLGYVHVLEVGQLNAYDVLVSDDIVFTKAAYDAFVAAKAGATEEVSA